MTAQAAEALDDDAASARAINLSRYAPAVLNRISNRWSNESSSLYRKRFRIGMSEWRLMALLASEPWSQAARVDQVIGMDKSAVSRTLRSLERRGLAVTRPNRTDPRRREMALTEKGQGLHGQIAKVALARADQLLADFTAEEVDQLFLFLNRLEGNLDGMVERRHLAQTAED